MIINKYDFPDEENILYSTAYAYTRSNSCGQNVCNIALKANSFSSLFFTNLKTAPSNIILMLEKTLYDNLFIFLIPKNHIKGEIFQ